MFPNRLKLKVETNPTRSKSAQPIIVLLNPGAIHSDHCPTWRDLHRLSWPKAAGEAGAEPSRRGAEADEEGGVRG